MCSLVPDRICRRRIGRIEHSRGLPGPAGRVSVSDQCASRPFRRREQLRSTRLLLRSTYQRAPHQPPGTVSGDRLLTLLVEQLPTPADQLVGEIRQRDIARCLGPRRSASSTDADLFDHAPSERPVPTRHVRQQPQSSPQTFVRVDIEGGDGRAPHRSPATSRSRTVAGCRLAAEGESWPLRQRGAHAGSRVMHETFRQYVDSCQAQLQPSSWRSPAMRRRLRRMTAEPTPMGWIPAADTLGSRLALLRQAMGWGNVKEGALACGQPVESWRSWERDGRLPRDVVRIAREISDATGCDYYWLLDGSTGPGTRTPRPQEMNGAGMRARRDSNSQPSDP